VNLLMERKPDRERAALPFHAADLYLAAVVRHNLLDQIQANAHPADLLLHRVAGAVEPLEKLWQRCCGNANAAIDDVNARLIALAFNLHDDWSTARAILDGVLHQVIHGTLKPRRISFDRE
jgi:hypothetical protein